MMHEDGGVGVLVNNVGTANEIPKHLEEFTDEVDSKEPSITNHIGAVLTNIGDKFHVTTNKEE